MRFVRCVLIVAAMGMFMVGCDKGPAEPAPAQTDPQDPAVVETPTEVPPSELTPARPVRLLHDAIDEAHQAMASGMLDRGVAFLLAHRDDDGGWSMEGGAFRPALTAMGLKILLQEPSRDLNDPDVKRALNVLLGFRQDDGGFYDPQQGMVSYTTSLSVMALAVVAREDESYKPMLDEAVTFLKGQQIIPGSESPDGEPIAEGDPFVGGVSYGQHGRPDMSNVGMWMQALHDAGVAADDPAMQRALAFVVRTQNRSESNESTWAAEGDNDGGFVYAPAVVGDPTAGESKAGEGVGGAGLRSYGSMTYVGFKSLIYAGLDREDPRVVAAYHWIRRYWRLDSNPNMPAVRSLQGLYYYYHAFAKALRAWGEPIIADPEGVEHNWRQELIVALAERVSEDVSWFNDADRWFEGDAVLVTCYAVLTLQEATQP